VKHYILYSCEILHHQGNLSKFSFSEADCKWQHRIYVGLSHGTFDFETPGLRTYKIQKYLMK
jgi:hypothetical protein